jgi:hypothetical protein
MPPKSKLTVSREPSKHSLSATERRAAQVVADSTKQAELKREAAERRARRAQTEH